jgi:hypothetical protein
MTKLPIAPPVVVLIVAAISAIVFLCRSAFPLCKVGGGAEDVSCAALVVVAVTAAASGAMAANAVGGDVGCHGPTRTMEAPFPAFAIAYVCSSSFVFVFVFAVVSVDVVVLTPQ